MIAICSDTHSRHDHELEGAMLEAVTEAELVIHAGDFTSVAALEAFDQVCGDLAAVHGNADDRPVRQRLPTRRTVEADGVRIAVVHRPRGGETGLSSYGQAEDADIVVFGHTHQPTLRTTPNCVLCNPGSHAAPRGNRPGYATLVDGTVALRDMDGTVVDSTSIA